MTHPTLFFSPSIIEYMYNADPVYGLFEPDGRYHPLSLPVFSQVVPVLLAVKPKKKKYDATICSTNHPSPPKDAFICNFQKSNTPKPVPQEVWNYLSDKQVDFSKHYKPATAPFSSVPLGFGRLVSDFYEREDFLSPVANLGIEAIMYAIVPYAPEVGRMVKLSDGVYTDDSPIPADYGFSYIYPTRLPALYRLLETEPTPLQMREACLRLFPECKSFAEQVALLSVSITLVAVAEKEKIERRAGRGLLVIGDRTVMFGHVQSSAGTPLSFDDLHRIVLTREPAPQMPIPPICQIEKLIAARIYFSREYTFSTPGERVLAYCALDSGGGWMEMVVDLPSHLAVVFPPAGLVSIARRALNYQEARTMGVEGWDIQIEEVFYQFSIPPDDAQSILSQIAAAREKRRAYSK